MHFMYLICWRGHKAVSSGLPQEQKKIMLRTLTLSYVPRKLSFFLKKSMTLFLAIITTMKLTPKSWTHWEDSHKFSLLMWACFHWKLLNTGNCQCSLNSEKINTSTLIYLFGHNEYERGLTRHRIQYILNWLLPIGAFQGQWNTVNKRRNSC